MLIALAALFMWSFLAATILPLGSEAPLAVYVRSYGQVVVPVLVATAGNYLGACTTYWLGRRAAQALSRGRDTPDDDTRSARLLRRFGPPALLLSWVPLLGDALVALAGAVRMPFGAFSFWAAAGKALRYAAVAWAASAVWREAG
jgi:membrane protein YqaA with SNARE-associated domain